jgi:hypothetical protein
MENSANKGLQSTVFLPDRLASASQLTIQPVKQLDSQPAV